MMSNIGRFAGSYQYLVTYLVTGSMIHLALFTTSTFYHGGCKWVKWFMSLSELSVLLFVHYDYFNIICVMLALFILNEARSDMTYMFGQYVMNLPFLRYYKDYDMFLVYGVVLGILIYQIINGASGLATSSIEASRARDSKEGVTESSTQG